MSANLENNHVFVINKYSLHCYEVFWRKHKTSQNKAIRVYTQSDNMRYFGESPKHPKTKPLELILKVDNMCSTNMYESHTLNLV